MHIIDNTTSDNHYAEIKKLSSISDELTIISPFCFFDFTNFYDQINTSQIKFIKFITTLREEEVVTKIKSICSFLSQASRHDKKCQIYINNRLHGKVYLFKYKGFNKAAIITSANITYNGLVRNHEWGCSISNVDTINNLEKNILSTIEYELKDELIKKICRKIKEKGEPVNLNPRKNKIDLSDIIIPYRFNIDVNYTTRVFLKPVGSTGNKIYEGDYSEEEEQYFSRKRPAAVRKNDYLISYAVGATKIISVFKVLSDEPLYNSNDDSRWPWHVEVENVTPKLGKQWWHHENLYITRIAEEYVEISDSNITNNGGKTLGALNWGADKIRLDHDFAMYLLSLIMEVVLP